MTVGKLLGAFMIFATIFQLISCGGDGTPPPAPRPLPAPPALAAPPALPSSAACAIDVPPRAPPGYFLYASPTPERPQGMPVPDITSLARLYGSDLVVGFDAESISENDLKALLVRDCAETAENEALGAAARNDARLHLRIRKHPGVPDDRWDTGPAVQILAQYRKAGFDSVEIDRFLSGGKVELGPSDTVELLKTYAARGGALPQLLLKNLTLAQWSAVEHAVCAGGLPRTVLSDYAVMDSGSQGDFDVGAAAAGRIGITLLDARGHHDRPASGEQGGLLSSTSAARPGAVPSAAPAWEPDARVLIEAAETHATPTVTSGRVGRLTPTMLNGTEVSPTSLGVVQIRNAVVPPGLASGTLLSNEWVLTCRHCVSDTSGSLTPGSVTVVFSSALKTQRSKVEKIVAHPDSEVDVVMLKLATPFKIWTGTAPDRKCSNSGYSRKIARVSTKNLVKQIQDVVCAGYGLNTYDRGHGTLRKGDFKADVAGERSQTYFVVHRNSQKQIPWRGDSGGPCIDRSGEIVGVQKDCFDVPEQKDVLFCRYVSSEAIYREWRDIPVPQP